MKLEVKSQRSEIARIENRKAKVKKIVILNCLLRLVWMIQDFVFYLNDSLSFKGEIPDQVRDD